MAIPIHNCRELARSLAFYVDVIGAKIEWTDEAPTTMFACVKWREHEIYLSAHSGDGVAGTATYVPVADVDAVYAALLARGFVPPDRADDPVHHAPTDQTWGMREFYIRDPDGNCLRFATPIDS
jgi:catechol 2,3-dioxygenase-like lactoylglutathione lyase family enzyme